MVIRFTVFKKRLIFSIVGNEKCKIPMHWICVTRIDNCDTGVPVEQMCGTFDLTGFNFILDSLDSFGAFFSKWPVT